MLDATNPSGTSPSACLPNDCADRVDFVEAGAGSLVVLVHSSMAGARQWSTLMGDLQDRSQVRAVNLFGYGSTPPWSSAKPPSLDDYAELVARAIPESTDNISLVGHSFGGAVAMRVAAHQLNGRVKSLVLIEPSLFCLLDRGGRPEAYREISALGDYTRQCIAEGNPQAAAERFIDYWCGAGTWAGYSAGKKSAFTQSIAVLPHEWHAVLGGNASLAEWTVPLPLHTLVMSSTGTTRPSREIADLLMDARPDWQYASIWDGGHMAPLTHPHLVNPIIRAFLDNRVPTAS